MSDKIFQRRKAAKRIDLERKKASRAEKKRVLIVCEGAKSEPLYFKKLIETFDLSKLKFEIYGQECGSDPISVVTFGEKVLNADADYDYAFFVFDRDAHPTYDNALSKIESMRKKVKFKNISLSAIVSIPCFELWLLLHSKQSTKPYAPKGKKSIGECVVDDLRNVDGFKEYGKGSCDYFDSIKGKIDVAIRNAEILVENAVQTGSDKYQGNPVTLIHEMIKELRSFSER